jgi:hypothetical protein
VQKFAQNTLKMIIFYASTVSVAPQSIRFVSQICVCINYTQSDNKKNGLNEQS